MERGKRRDGKIKREVPPPFLQKDGGGGCCRRSKVGMGGGEGGVLTF